MSNKFCTSCGAVIGLSSKFCGKCGTKVMSESTKAVDLPIQNYRYIVQARYKKGILSQKDCTLILSDTEIIVAMVDNKLMQQHLASVKASVKSEKFIKRTAVMMKAGYTFSDRYRDMNPANIISETPQNFTIGNNTVESVRFKRGFTTYNEDVTTNTPPLLTVKGTGGKTVFIFNMSVDDKSLISTLQTIYGSRYKGPKR